MAKVPLSAEFVKTGTIYDIELAKTDVPTQVKIGSAEKFVPNINVSKWNDEAWLNINHPDVVTAEKETFVDNKIELPVGNNIHRYYEKDNHLEYEIVLKTKPASNKIELGLAFPAGLEFWYQDTIENEYKKDSWGCKTLEEYRNRINRPPEVEGSYAVYWKNSNNQYKTGKFCHIYRPLIIDANNIQRWAALNIIENKLIIECDFTGLTFPVTIDPDLGYSTKGGSSWTQSTKADAACHGTTDGSGGNTVQLHAWCKNGSGSADEMLMCIYDDDAGNNRPEDQLLAEVAISVADAFDGQKDVGYITALAASTKYWVAFMNKSDLRIAEYYDTGSTNAEVHWQRATYDMPANWGNVGTNSNTHWSIWADYTAGGGISIPVVMKHLREQRVA